MGRPKLPDELKMKTMNLRMGVEDRERLTRLAQMEGRKMSAIIRDALIDYERRALQRQKKAAA
jgi:predicted DNA-binding protein